MPKKQLTKQEKSEQRKHKAVQWLAAYNGAHVVRAYRKKFNVDTKCALRELEEIGVSFTEQEKKSLLDGQEARLQHQQQERDNALLQIADNITLQENTILDFCDGEEEILAVMRESGAVTPKKVKQGLPKTGKGIIARFASGILPMSDFRARGIRRISVKPAPPSSKRSAREKAKIKNSTAAA